MRWCHTSYSLYPVTNAIVFVALNVFVWTGKNDSSMLRVNARFFENKEKTIRRQKKSR